MKRIQHQLLVIAVSVLLTIISIGFTTKVHAQMGKCKGKYLGNTIQNSTRADYGTYWNQATCENGSKWGSVEGTQGVYNFGTSDVAYNYCKNNNALFKYHNFVWGSQAPAYVSTASTTTLTTAIENYIKAVAAHYNPMGGLRLIDVVNEPIKTALPGNYKAALTAGYQRDNPGGTDQYGWIIWAFQLARKNFPTAKLLINEYSIENDPNGALVTYAAMVNAVKNAPNLTDGQKNLIDGIGLQCHAFSIQTLSAVNFKAALDKLYTLTGLPMHITEMDIDANANETTQLNQYKALFSVAWEHPQVAGITLWGYVQGLTWRNGNGTTGAGGTDSGILYATGTGTAAERPALTWIKTYMALQLDISPCPDPGTVGPGWSSATCTIPSAPTITTPVAYCQGATASALTATGTGLLWYTVATGGTGSATAPTPVTTTAGTINYYVSQTINSCESPRAMIAVTVNGKPTVTITSPAKNATVTSNSINITTTTTGTGISRVEFYNGKIKLGEDLTSPYTYTWSSIANGSYTITAKVTDSNNCVDSASESIQVSILTGLLENQQNSGYRIYPNPFDNNLTIEKESEFDYTIYDMIGNIVEKGIAKGTIKVGNDLRAGVYIVKISSQQGSRFIKVTKN